MNDVQVDFQHPLTNYMSSVLISKIALPFRK